MKAETLTFAQACRENTGAHMLDSGCAYGRHHEQPPIPEDAPVIKEWVAGCPATLETSAFLDDCLEIQHDMQAAWEKWDAEHPDLDWFESGSKFLAERGYVQRARGNVYNGENDLSQVYIYEVYTLDDAKNDKDWVYNDDDTITIIRVHTGCDVRGGYGRPIFCRSRGDYSIPVDFCAQYRAVKGWNSDGEELDSSTLQEIDEQWQNGYSSYPYGKLVDDVAEWHEDTRTRNSVEVTLHTGVRVLVEADGPYV